MTILILTSHELRIDQTVELEVGNEIYNIRALELGCIHSHNTKRFNGYLGPGKKPIKNKACSISSSSSSSSGSDEHCDCDNQVGEESKRQQLGQEEMIGVNLGPKTWVDVVDKNCLDCETLEEHQDQVEGLVSKQDRPDLSNNDLPLTHRKLVHIASVLDLGDDADEQGLTPLWTESINKLNRTHNQSLDPKNPLS
ncbi:hypothetical protein GQ457_10G006810 [Hibiscus cannabinus]